MFQRGERETRVRPAEHQPVSVRSTSLCLESAFLQDESGAVGSCRRVDSGEGEARELPHYSAKIGGAVEGDGSRTTELQSGAVDECGGGEELPRLYIPHHVARGGEFREPFCLIQY